MDHVPVAVTTDPGYSVRLSNVNVSAPIGHTGPKNYHTYARADH